MKLAIVILGVFMMAGCSQQKQDTVVGQAKPATSPAPLTEAQKINLLRILAHKRHLHWKVICADTSYGEFLAIAKQAGDNDYPYIEDGAKDGWGEWGATQADAAYALYQSIQQSPNMHAEHRPGVVAHKMCPAELRGE